MSGVDNGSSRGVPPEPTEKGLVLSGPDGANPLGFLCSIGTLRAATLAWPDHTVHMAWRQYGVGWRPVLFAEPALTRDELVQGLFGYCRFGKATGTDEEERDSAEVFPYFAFDKNTSKISPEDFRRVAIRAVSDSAAGSRAFADFVAAFGCEACVQDKGFIEDTALRTMSGSGWQHFLGTMLHLVDAVEPKHVQAAILEPWRYGDPLSKKSMRWDPLDLKQYALQWGDPSNDPTRAKRGSMLGANRLAIEALPVLPTAPVRGKVGRPRLATTGFELAREPYWTWPIWDEPISLQVCASLLAHPILQKIDQGKQSSSAMSGMDQRDNLKAMGVAEVFRSRRISVDYYRNFTPARAV